MPEEPDKFAAFLDAGWSIREESFASTEIPCKSGAILFVNVTPKDDWYLVNHSLVGFPTGNMLGSNIFKSPEEVLEYADEIGILFGRQ